MMIESLPDISVLVRLTAYILFIGGTIFTFIFSACRYVKEFYLSIFLTGLFAVTLVGIPMFPFIEMHKFAHTHDDDHSYHEITIVDEQGNELEYDSRAAPPVQGTRVTHLATSMANEYSDEERLKIASFLLSNANEYKESVRRGDHKSLQARLSAPRYVDDSRWTQADLDGVSEFQSIRIYERTIQYSDDNSEVANSSRQLILEVDSNGTIQEEFQ